MRKSRRGRGSRARRRKLSLKSRMDTTRIEDVRVEAITPLTDSTKREPGMGMRQRTGVIKLVKMPVMASFTPTLTSTLPFAYAFDEKTGAGACCQSSKCTASPSNSSTRRLPVMAQAFAVDTRDRTRAFGNGANAQGRRRALGRPVEPHRCRPDRTSCAPGSRIGLLAFYLLEPESEDGLMQWSFFDNIVAAHADFPVLRITMPATLRSHARPRLMFRSIAALPLQSAARLQVRSQQQAREELRHRASSPARRSTKRSPPYAR